MLRSKLFYISFLADYFILRATTYKSIIENDDLAEVILSKSPNGLNKENYIKSLKASLRQNYFHSIETLFEIMFAIEMGLDKKSDPAQDELIQYHLTHSSKKNLKRIEPLGKEENTAPNFLDREYIFVIDGEQKTFPLLQYLFYYIISPIDSGANNATDEELQESLSAIRLSIQHLAKDFTDRTEYNSYKHRFRLMPIFGDDDTMMFMTPTPDNVLEFTTRVFDVERDYKMTRLVSDLIQAIIHARKSYYFKDIKPNPAFFKLDEVRDYVASRIKSSEAKVTLTFEKPR